MSQAPPEPDPEPEASPSDQPDVVPSSEPGGGSTVIPVEPSVTNPDADGGEEGNQ